MATEKKVPLSIVIRTVDNATAKLTAINKRIEDAFKPFKNLKEQAAKFSENLGLPTLQKRLGALRDFLGKLVLGLGAVAGAAGLAFNKLMGMVDELDELGDTAQRIGITAEALAEYRHAAEQSGAETGEIDSALEGFNKRLGELKRNQGQLSGLLKQVNPHFREQLKNTKSAEEAFGLLANAVAQMPDPLKRAQLVTAAFGKSAGPGLLGLLSQGADGVEALKKEFQELSGNTTNQAVAGADKIKAAQQRARVAFEGVRNTLVMELAPALEGLFKRASAFIVENRAKIVEWARDFGEKLPGRIDALITAFQKIYNVAKTVWDAIGGAKGAVIALVAVITGKLLVAIGAVVASLAQIVAGLRAASSAAGAAGGAGGAMGLAGRAGQAGAVLAAGAGGYALGSYLDSKFGISDKLSESDTAGMTGSQRGIYEGVQNPWQQNSLALQNRIKNIKRAQAMGGVAYGGAPQKSEAKVKIEIKGAPAGTRVTTDPNSTADVDTVVGHQTEYAL